MDRMLAAALAGPLLLAAGVVLIVWDRRRARRQERPMVDDGPEDEPYRVFTRRYDLEIAAAEISTRLPEASRDRAMGWIDGGRKWVANRAQLRRFDSAQKSPREIADMLRHAMPDSGELAICLLIDQSGSMLGAPIGATASAVRALSDALADCGIPTEILGFSTVGWQGGFARRDWVEQGSPKRPGRLCALLHVIYKDTGTGRWDDASRDAFLHPDMLRENIDGEAIEWAAARLHALPQSRKILLVLSDGAPVDDSTLTENGPSYLWRHARATIARLERSDTIRLGGIGVGYRVNEFYRHSREAELGSIADAAIELIAELAQPR